MTETKRTLGKAGAVELKEGQLTEVAGGSVVRGKHYPEVVGSRTFGKTR